MATAIMACVVPPAVRDPARLAALEQYAVLDTPPEPGFDDIVQLACQFCAVPVALVSLVASDRQWFKARVGFPACETDLNSSVCAHALAEPDRLLVIPDLAADPRTCNNPLVTHEPFIRFYAGAPLVTPEGLALGSLCVIDKVPRPGGLTAGQEDALKALARQVVTQLELRRAVATRDAVRVQEGRLYQAREALRDTQAAVASAEGDLDAILHAVVMGAMRAMPAADGGVFELIEGDELEYRAVRGTLSAHKGLRLPLHGTIAGHCALTRTSILVDDEMSDPRLSNAVIRRIGQSAAVFAPVIRSDRVLGVVKLQSSRPAAFNEADLAQLELFAGIGSNGLTAAEARAQILAQDVYWRSLFNRLSEGFLVGEVVRDTNGRAVDWRYIEVNPAWGTLLGIDPASVLGRSVREAIPGIEDAWIDQFTQVVDTGEPVSFTRQVDVLSRWYEGRVFKLDGDRFGVIFLDVTARIKADQALAAGSRRRESLLRLGDELRNSADADDMAAMVAGAIGETLGADQAAYASVDADAETIMVDRAWSSQDVVSSVRGQHAFRDYGSYIDELKAGQTVMITDVSRDRRTSERAASFAALGIAAIINVPLIEHGRLVAVVLATFNKPRMVEREEEIFVRTAADRTRAGIARVHADERQAILNGEISHRLKNTLSVVQAIASQTFKGTQDREAADTFAKRLVALGTAQDVLLKGDWAAADLGEVVDQVLDAAGIAGRFTAAGPRVRLGARAALSTSLLLHELATNAGKYGSLTAEGGGVEVGWRLDHDGDAQHLALTWREHGGPAAEEPVRKGFGSRLLRMGLVGTGGSDIAYGPRGLLATFRAPLKQVEQA